MLFTTGFFSSFFCYGISKGFILICYYTKSQKHNDHLIIQLVIVFSQISYKATTPKAPKAGNREEKKLTPRYIHIKQSFSFPMLILCLYIMLMKKILNQTFPMCNVKKRLAFKPALRLCSYYISTIKIKQIFCCHLLATFVTNSVVFWINAAVF